MGLIVHIWLVFERERLFIVISANDDVGDVIAMLAVDGILK